MSPIRSDAIVHTVKVDLTQIKQTTAERNRMELSTEKTTKQSATVTAHQSAGGNSRSFVNLLSLYNSKQSLNQSNEPIIYTTPMAARNPSSSKPNSSFRTTKTTVKPRDAVQDA